MRSRHDISVAQRQAVRAEIRRLLGLRTEILVAMLFGSFTAPGSFGDVDVGVIVDGRQVTREGEFNWVCAVAGELEAGVGLPVDLVVLNAAPAALRYDALCGEVLLSRDDELREDSLIAAWKEYWDLEPFLRSTARDLLEGEVP